MAFEIRRDESIAHGLRRLAKKELADACERLERSRSPSEEAIHEARKSVKKVRALVHLLKTAHASGLSGTNKRLRAANRVLSQRRDADVMIETLAKLDTELPHPLSEHTMARLKRQLLTHKDSVAEASVERLSGVTDTLRIVRDRAKRWSPDHSRFRLLAAGLRRTHKNGRDAMAEALTRGGADDFHTWRKELKALWYELRLVEHVSRSVQRDVKALKDAETFLGDDHNVAVLCAYLSRTHSSASDPQEMQRLRDGAGAYQDRLRRLATSRARRIYAAKTAAYVRAIKQAWKTARDSAATGSRTRPRTRRRLPQRSRMKQAASRSTAP